MKNLSIVLAAGTLVLGLASITPSFAASIGECQNDISSVNSPADPIDANSTSILASLQDKGINARDVTDWGGCIKADVVHKSGRIATEYFDPSSLQRLNPNG